MTKNKESSISQNKPAISHSTLLQMNATIIAGLLILLTFQLSDDTAQEDFVQDMRKLEIEESLLEQKIINSTEGLKEKMENRLENIKLEREGIKAELIAITKIPYVIYTKINPVTSMAPLIFPFILSSAVILIKSITKQISENYHPKWALRFTTWGLGMMGFYFLYQMFPLGRIWTDQFI